VANSAWAVGVVVLSSCRVMPAQRWRVMTVACLCGCRYEGLDYQMLGPRLHAFRADVTTFFAFSFAQGENATLVFTKVWVLLWMLRGCVAVSACEQAPKR